MRSQSFTQSSNYNCFSDVSALPLILAGPILRHTNEHEVTVWLATKEARSLRLEIYETSNGGSKIGELLFSGIAETISLGQHLHLATITAFAKLPLLPAKIYAYNICCLDSDDDLIKDQQEQNSFSYFPHQLPTFTLPSAGINSLRIVHGSCRKPHGGGVDALAFLDSLIGEQVDSVVERPQQLFLTGDQIYGDDVADPLLWLIQQLTQLLFGWQEELPLIEGHTLATDLPPGKRTKIARIEGGFTAMLHGKPEKAKSHLFSFAEYAVAYLLSWSPVLALTNLTTMANLPFDTDQQWQTEAQDIQDFSGSLFRVRRALANIVVYTICDDHDVSDDWYLNRNWCDRVLGKPLGKRVVQNGLLAYALFQAWGNTPQYFRTGTAGAELIGLATKWLQSQGKDDQTKQMCDRFLGIPDNDPQTGLPEFVTDGENLVLARDQAAIPWHYAVNSSQHEVIVLDTRTWRGYPPGRDQELQPPMLLCPQAFTEQLLKPLQQSPPEIAATFVVLPTNLVALGIIDRIQQSALSRDRVFSTDVGDSWNFHEEAFARLLLTLCQQRERVIILSGDIHYSCAVSLTHWDVQSKQTSLVVQLTSSAIKNSELATRLAHTRIKDLFKEKTKHYLGWHNPLKIEPRGIGRKGAWEYSVKWCKRQPAKSLSWGLTGSRDLSKPSWWQKMIRGLTNLFWRNRWLQEGSEVVGRNNLSLVRFRWQKNRKSVIQETFWRTPWNHADVVKSCYEIPLDFSRQPK